MQHTMDVEIITWSEVRLGRELSYDVAYMWNHHDTNELIHKTETDSQT